MPPVEPFPEAITGVGPSGPSESPSPPGAAIVIVAAGRGTRAGAADKVFLPLAGRPILAHVLDAVSQTQCVQGVVLVMGEHTREAAERLAQTNAWPMSLSIVNGGARRQDSVTAGVAAVPAEATVVLIHDGARPLVEPALFDRCAAAAVDVGAAIAAVPVSDTLKRVESARVVGTVARESLWAAQTPQAFRRDLLVAALASPLAQSHTFTDEAGLFEALGLPVAVVQGSMRNLKVTHPDDLQLAAALLAGGNPSHDPSVRPAQDPIWSVGR